MSKRPAAITIIAWVILLLSILGIASDFYIIINHEKMHALYAQLQARFEIPTFFLVITFLSPVLNFIFAIGLLKAMNWARHLYLFYNAIIYLITLILAPQKLPMIVLIIFFLLFLYFLYNRPAQKYFTKRITNPSR